MSAPGLSGTGAAGGADAVAAGLARLQQAGVELDAMAVQALGSLPPDHAAEMLEYVAENHAYLRNPSRYISSTVSRGFVPRRTGALAGVAVPPAGCGAGAGDCPPGPAMPMLLGAAASAAAPEGLERLLAQAQEMGLVLSSDAVQALSGLPPEHASELLEFVMEKCGELRDPSNYIASTVARGFKSRRSSLPPPAVTSSATTSEVVAGGLQRAEELGVEIDDLARQALASLPPEHALEMLDYVTESRAYLRNPSNYISSTVARGFVPRRSGTPTTGKGAPAATLGVAVNPHMVPQDVTHLERRILQLNSQSLAGGQQVDFATYLALRCVPQWQATELLDSLEAKSTVISSPCNYIQAAVSKIQRGQGWSGGYSGFGRGYPTEENGRVAPAQYSAAVTGAVGASTEQMSFKRQRMW